MSDSAASLLARLKNKSKEIGIPLQQLINLFCQEEFLRRLSKSDYKDNLILKGGFLIYTISNFASRATIDADYLLKNYSNDIETIRRMVEEVISLHEENSFVELQIKGLEIISETKKYHGVRVNLVGIVGKTKTPFSIDFGIGDIVVPSEVERTLPVLISGFEEPKVLTYSLYSTVAEKLDAIISLMEYTGRMKDFYDIYYLAITFDFDGRKLQEAIYETLSNRARKYEKDSVAVIARLTENNEIKNRWNNFCNKVLKYQLDFNYVTSIILGFTLPPYEAIIQEGELFNIWSHKDKKYI
ncbi:nucleotidyl transferase AbiEii/AbiGii toxin family protein [Sedimentibacter sp.]|uniref:nucleotidyl transferase AbiEii/AbiGii toxin family protein n=1 Tax=Sedimentibacter sp. TaxID=1960295 RepID=UPI0028A1BDB7|nr:nucleotidyl transferase AbiEii/AbiGii toxin family protein [Sedimentibacter sp.]